MTYKLPVERAHRVAKGASPDTGKKRQVLKGERGGRLLSSRYDADADQIVMRHATKGPRYRNRVAMLGPTEPSEKRRWLKRFFPWV